MASKSNVTKQKNHEHSENTPFTPFIELKPQSNLDSHEIESNESNYRDIHDNDNKNAFVINEGTVTNESIEIVAALEEDNSIMAQVQHNGSFDHIAKSEPNEKSKEKHDDPEHKHSKHKRKPHVRSAFKEYMTTLSHICVFSFTTLIVYLCLTREFRFFTWHPLLLSLGWAFGMTESILTLSRDNVLYSGHSHQFQKKVHWIILIPSGIFILVGFIIVIINKNNHDPPKEHFTSWHSIFGLIGVICSVPPYINGTMLWFKKELSDYINGKLIKFVHIASGILAFAFGSVSVFLSLYTRWFGKNTNHMDSVFYFGVVTATFPVLWAMVKPTMMCYRTIANRLTNNND